MLLLWMLFFVYRCPSPPRPYGIPRSPDVAEGAGGYAGPASTDSAIIAYLTVGVTSAAEVDAEAIVDTTGAGDAFMACFVASIAAGLSLEQTLRLGSCVAAANCTALGARGGMPTRDELVAVPF